MRRGISRGSDTLQLSKQGCASVGYLVLYPNIRNSYFAVTVGRFITRCRDSNDAYQKLVISIGRGKGGMIGGRRESATVQP